MVEYLTGSLIFCEVNLILRCLLQIRLPDGRTLREKFAADATLQDVSNLVESKVKNMSNLVFMQVSKSLFLSNVVHVNISNTCVFIPISCSCSPFQNKSSAQNI